MYIQDIVIIAILIVTGLCLGSFAGASVWRLRAMQLRKDKKQGEDFDAKEYQKLQKIMNKTLTNDHSCCLDCGYKLKWYDMIPVFSWLSLGGKCRKCRKKIGSMELVIEIFVATYFVASYIFWPNDLSGALNIFSFVLWLISGVVFAILFFYDKKWFLLPDSISFCLAALGLLSFLSNIIFLPNKLELLISTGISLIILSGIYLFVYFISKGKWIGFGDIKLGVGLALILQNWELAFMALFLANFIGCLVVLPGLVSGKLKKDTHIPFGPFLIIGTVIVYLFGPSILNYFFIL